MSSHIVFYHNISCHTISYIPSGVNRKVFNRAVKIGVEWNKYEHQFTGMLRRTRTGSHIVLDKTSSSASICRLLGRWVAIDGWASVPFTSITLNKDFQAARHRDKHNTGPSVVRALGHVSTSTSTKAPITTLRLKSRRTCRAWLLCEATLGVRDL